MHTSTYLQLRRISAVPLTASPCVTNENKMRHGLWK